RWASREGAKRSARTTNKHPSGQGTGKHLMSTQRAQVWRIVAFGLVILVLAGAIIAAAPFVRNLLPWGKPPATGAYTGSSESESPAEAVAGRPNPGQLPAEVVRRLQILTEAVRPATQARQLELSGKLAFDTSRLARVHSRFAGELMSIEPVRSVPNGSTAE